MKESRELAVGCVNDELWSMRSVVSRTGISEHTLRAWEKRFGFPQPIRLPSGHRRYTSEDVQRLQLITEAMELGYRAGDVVRADPNRLVELVGRTVDPPDRPGDEDGWVERILDASARFDRPVVSAEIRHFAAATGTLRFLQERVVPLLGEVGERWSLGRLDIRHEHFISEVLDDELRSLRRRLETAGGRGSILLAGLPDEQHALGMQMVALLAASRGVRPHLLGLRVPVSDIAETASTTLTDAVGATISGTVPTDVTRDQIHDLRRRLPPGVELWLGGAGASRVGGLPEGTLILSTLEATDAALARLG